MRYNKLLVFLLVFIVNCGFSGTQAHVKTDFPFSSQFVSVHGHKMHYVSEGESQETTFLLLHGNPTSSYLWRNIIPHLTPHGRVIAVDLIGMGLSDKPVLAYRVEDHYRCLKGFIEKLELKNITLVVHDWGSALGFQYAMEHENNVRAIAFMEAITRPSKWSDVGMMDRYLFKLLRDDRDGHKMIVEDNFFIDSALQMMTARKLSDVELAHYAAPYKKASSRVPLWIFPREIPIDGSPADVDATVTRYARWLESTKIPKLLIWASPGMIIKKRDVVRLRNSLRNLQVIHVGTGLHFLQEDQPRRVGEALVNWHLGTLASVLVL